MATDELTKKETRKANRDARRTERATAEVDAAAKSAGISFDQQPAVSTTTIPEDYIESATKSRGLGDDAAKSIVGTVKAFADKYGNAPQLQQTNTREAEIEAAKKARSGRARWHDALYGIGESLQGRQVNPDMLYSTQYQRARDDRFQEYKKIVSANQATAQAWDIQKNRDILNKIDQELERIDKTSQRAKDLEEEFKYYEKKIAANEASAKRVDDYRTTNDIKYANEKPVIATKKSSSVPKTDYEKEFRKLYGVNSGVAEDALVEILNDKDRARVRENIIDSFYDDSGNPYPDANERLNQLNDLISENAQLQAALKTAPVKEKAAITAKINTNKTTAKELLTPGKSKPAEAKVKPIQDFFK